MQKKIINFFQWLGKLRSKKFPRCRSGVWVSDLCNSLQLAQASLPVSLAIGFASGLSPWLAVLASIITALFCGLYGGISIIIGPSAIMTIFIADIMHKYGGQFLWLVTCTVGILEILSAIWGLNRLVRYLSSTVTSAIISGIGVLIILTHIPHAFNIPALHQSDHLPNALNLYSIGLFISGALIIRIWLKYLPTIHPVLPLVIITSIIVQSLQLHSPTIGAIPHQLLHPLAWLHAGQFNLFDLAIDALIIYLIAVLETIRTCNVARNLPGIDSAVNTTMLCQGVTNIMLGLLGAIPVFALVNHTKLISKNFTYSTHLMHAVFLGVAIIFFTHWLALIPLIVLSGIMCYLALAIIDYKQVFILWRNDRIEAIIYIITFVMIIAMAVFVGIKASLITALVILLWKAISNMLLTPASTINASFIRFTVTGPVTFLFVEKILHVQHSLSALKKKHIVLLDLSAATNLDHTGATAIIELYRSCRTKKVKFYIIGLQHKFHPLLLEAHDAGHKIKNILLTSEWALKLKKPQVKSFYANLVTGVTNFYNHCTIDDKISFTRMANQQNPHTFLITCSDSRIVPSILTSTHPGELFILRNVGNTVPAYNAAAYNENILCSEAASLEFALNKLDITDLVVCGHSNCGAINACCNFETLHLSPQLSLWIKAIRNQLDFSTVRSVDETAKLHVLQQIDNLNTYPIVQQKLLNGSLRLHAWFFEIAHAQIYTWDTASKSFKLLGD